MDSEWVTREDPHTGKPFNHVLSVQLAVDVEGKSYEEILYTRSGNPRKRFRLDALVTMTIKKLAKLGMLSAFPTEVIIIGHFLRADLPNFADFWARKTLMDGFGRTFTGKTRQSIDWDASDEPQSSKSFALIMGGTNDRQIVKVRYADTMLLTPGRGSLDSAASLIGEAKVDLPPGFTKDRMDLFLKADPVAFANYALHDARLTLKYYLHMEQFARKELGLSKLPLTLAGMGIAGLKKHLRAQGVDLNGALSQVVVDEKRYSARTNRYYTYRSLHPTFARQGNDEWGAMCYHGGRNESFYCGPSPTGVFFDLDLASAYTTAMCGLYALDFRAARYTTHLASFGIDTTGLERHDPNIAGMARVRFEFSPETRFPCLPVRLREGMIFPLKGESRCTAPELLLAYRLGAKLEILEGVVIPWLDEQPIFMDFITKVQANRAKAQAKSLLDAIWKEMGNSLYGKLGQGVHERRAFDPKTGTSNRFPPSAITSPWHAAHVTGFIRAVLGELIAAVPSQYRIISATTDGFLTDAPFDEIPLDGPLTSEFRRFRKLAFNDNTVLVEKHRVAQVVAMKTRGQMTGESIPGYPIVLAKAGVKPLAESADHNEYMLGLYLNREFGEKHPRNSLSSMRDMWMNESDLVACSHDITLNLDFDFKRRPIDPVALSVPGYIKPHLAFDTLPWETVDHAERAYISFKAWSARNKRVLKSLADFEDFSSYLSQYEAIHLRNLQVRADGSFGVLKRQFLRAWVRELWGFSRDGWIYETLVGHFADRGFHMTLMDVKNAKRPNVKVIAHSVVLDDHSFPMLREIHRIFPEAEIGKLMRTGDLERFMDKVSRS